MTGIGESYAQALYALANEENITAVVLEQLKSLETAFRQEPDFLRLLSNPGISKDERCAIIEKSFRQVIHPYVLNTLKLLTEKGHIRQFAPCVKAYREQYNRENGIVSVLAVTAVAMGDEQRDKLQRKLEMVTGKTVELLTRVDETCIGGIRLDYDGKRVDATVKSRLDSMRDLLNNTVL